MLTPVTNTNSLLLSCVKHGTDNHEARSDGAFAHSEDEADGEETSKVLASCVATQSNSPDEYVQARDAASEDAKPDQNVHHMPHPFSDGKPLQR